MKTYIFQDSKTTFRRISKRAARKLWGSTTTAPSIALCPVKLRPGFPWAPHITYHAAEQIERPFDTSVNSFEYYNCNLNETGYYTAFYIVQ